PHRWCGGRGWSSSPWLLPALALLVSVSEDYPLVSHLSLTQRDPRHSAVLLERSSSVLKSGRLSSSLYGTVILFHREGAGHSPVPVTSTPFWTTRSPW